MSVYQNKSLTLNFKNTHIYIHLVKILHVCISVHIKYVQISKNTYIYLTLLVSLYLNLYIYIYIRLFIPNYISKYLNIFFFQAPAKVRGTTEDSDVFLLRFFLRWSCVSIVFFLVASALSLHCRGLIRSIYFVSPKADGL